MDDLTRCLYEFVCRNRMMDLFQNREYKELAKEIEQQEKKIAACLNQEQRKELHRLIDCITNQDSIENEHMFQATLSFAKELNTLVRK